VTIDGVAVEPFALVNVAPGKHAVHVAAPGYRSRDLEAPVPQGAHSIVDVVLEPEPGHIAIATEPGARIAIDGRAAGVAPHAPIEIAGGQHLVTIERRGREPIVRVVAVGNGQQVAVDAPLVATTRRRSVRWVIRGAGALAIASGATALVAGVAQHDALAILRLRNATGNLDSAQAAAYEADRGRRDAFAAAAWLTGGAAVAAAAVALALYRFDDPTPDTTRVVPLLSSSGGGVALGGRF
jgi:hypothetical protein